MKILFIDETDRQKGNQHNRAYFVLCGLIIEVSTMFKASSELEGLLVKYHMNSLKEARKNKLDKSEKVKITKDVFKILKKYDSGVRAIYLGDLTMKLEQKISNTYLESLGFLIERFFLSLNRDRESGLVIMDSLNPKTEADLRKKFYKQIQNGYQMWSKSEKKNPFKSRIFPWLLFSDDDTNVFLQVTDLIAASLNSSIWNSINGGILEVEKLPQKNEYLRIYWPLFIKSPTGKVDGWGVKIWN